MADEEYRQPRFTPPSGATEILLVRHGESAPARVGEPFPMVDGHGDPPLAPDGHHQAAAVGERLRGEPIDAVYVSSLQRTHQTAAPLVDAIGVEPRIEPELREVHLGEWEGGVFRKHVADGHPIAQQMFESRRWDAIPGAESNEAFSHRVTGALSRLHERHRDERLAVFVHGGVIGAAVAHAVGGDPFGFAAVDNGSVTHVVVLDEWWHLRTYNDTAHLGPFLAASG
ncbi:MAG: histidine phosphatase family protein [Actinomycetota bacterium]